MIGKKLHAWKSGAVGVLGRPTVGASAEGWVVGAPSVGSSLPFAAAQDLSS